MIHDFYWSLSKHSISWFEMHGTEHHENWIPSEQNVMKLWEINREPERKVNRQDKDTLWVSVSCNMRNGLLDVAYITLENICLNT